MLTDPYVSVHKGLHDPPNFNLIKESIDKTPTFLIRHAQSIMNEKISEVVKNGGTNG